MQMFYIFLIFFEFLMLDSKHGQNGGRARYYLEVEYSKTLSVSLMKPHVVYLKMIFIKKSGANYEALVVQIQQGSF